MTKPSRWTSLQPTSKRSSTKAVAYAKANGKAAALKAFTQSGGDFHQGQLYIYAYDFSGTVIAHGGDSSLVGKDLSAMTDPNGVRVVAELSRLATQGGGWLYFTWPNPAHNNQQEPKLGYVVKVDDTWFPRVRHLRQRRRAASDQG